MLRALLGSVAVGLLLASGAAASEYVIVVSSHTQGQPEWAKVTAALQDKHQGAELVTWNENVKEALEPLQKRHPRFTCFVAQRDEAGKDFVADVHRLTRKFDDDPYTDTLWGILTGFDAANALQIAQTSEPLTVQNTAAGTEVALEMCRQGLWYDELEQHKKVSKAADGQPQQERGPADTTHALADSLAGAELFVTSGHATERDWQIGFRYRNGQFRSEAGQLFGKTVAGERFEIRADKPKVYMAVGNCLMGHIDGADAMALAWMNSAGVRQMIGYTVVTWYGYGGWGVLDYFVEQPGRYTLCEAFHANQRALIHRLDTCFSSSRHSTVAAAESARSISPNAAGEALNLTAQDAQGLIYDRDTVAFYGDPAWQARMAPQPCAYDQKLTVEGDKYTLTITPRRGAESFQPVNTNGSQRGGRPIVALLEHRIRDVQVTEGADLKPVVSDDFILIPNPLTCDPTREYRVSFTAQRM